MGMDRIKLSDQIKEAINRCAISRAEIARRTGIAESTLSRFVAGTAGMTLKHLDQLTDLLGLNITTGPTKLPKKVVPREPTQQPKETRKRKGG